MVFLMKVRKFKTFISVSVRGSKAPIGLNNGVNFIFYRYLHDPVVNLTFHSFLSFFKLIFRL